MAGLECIDLSIGKRRRARTGALGRIGAFAVATVAVPLLTGCGAGSNEVVSESSVALTLESADVRVLGTSESIARVKDLEILPDGSVWLLNSVEPFFIGLRQDGEVIATHGQAGGGPEEYRMPSGFLTGGLAGEAWVLDFLRHAFIQVSDPDAGWSQLSVPTEPVPQGSLFGGMDMMSQSVRTARLGEEIILPRTAGSMDLGVFAFRMAVLRADLVAFDPRTGSVRDVVALGEVLGDPMDDFVPTEGGFPLWYRLWAVCGEDIRVYDRARNQLLGFTASGEEVEPINLPPVRLTAVTPRQFARAVFPLRQAEVTGTVGSRVSRQDSLAVVNRIIQGIRGEPQQLANYLPRYVDLRCSEDGTVWMHPLDVDIGGLGGGPLWLRIDAVGRATEVLLPPRFDALSFTPDRAWGVQRDEFDVASVASIALPAG